MGLLALVGLIAQEQVPPGNGWQGWVFVAGMILVPIILAKVLSRGK
jgi:hypothetical protein